MPQGFFAGRVDAWEHLALLVGVPCGLLPAFRTNETLEVYIIQSRLLSAALFSAPLIHILIEPQQHAPFDKTSDFLYHMPSCISRPQPGVSEARYGDTAWLNVPHRSCPHLT